MIGAGTIINPILKIVTTVAILGAAYIFIVKPVLDTTEDITGDVAEQTRQAQINANEASEEFDLNFAKDRAESFATSLRTQWPEAAREVTELRSGRPTRTRRRWRSATSSGTCSSRKGNPPATSRSHTRTA